MNPLRIHYLKHDSAEGLGSIEDWIIKNNFKLSCTKLYEEHVFPDVDSIDWLIIMGGPMSVYEEQKYPWLVEEKKFIHQVINKNKVVLGICLGSQLIADVLGAKVYPNKLKEIGWFPVNMLSEVKNNKLFSNFSDEMMVFQWHGDTFDIPEGAIHLAKSEACKNQAFVYNEKTLALQFHFEVTFDDIDGMVKNFGHELVKSTYVQTVKEIEDGKKYVQININYMNNILGKFSQMK